MTKERIEKELQKTYAQLEQLKQKAKDLEERTALIAHLKEKGVGAVFHYIPLHSAPAGESYGRFHGEDKYTTKESERIVRLPLYYGLDEADLCTVVEAVKSFYVKE